jgi:hypothetical protein
LLDAKAQSMVRPIADNLTLRGIMALEQGDTAAARSHLRAALKMAGPGVFFVERPIAERYVELLEAEGK